MAINNTINQTPVFREWEPDWGYEVDYVVKWLTGVSGGFDGGEQRARFQGAARYELRYRVDGLSIPDYSERRAAVELELGRPVVVPLWPRPSTLTSLVAQVATISGPPNKRAFKAGGYAYFVETGLTSVFCQVTAVSATTITIAAGNAAYPDIAVPAFTSAALVYPCIIASHMENTANFDDSGVDNKSEIVEYVEL